MKIFINSTLLFLILLLGLLLILEVGSREVINSKIEVKIKSKPQILLVGHSHPECAFNDSLINNFKNLAESGESYFYTYFKLQEVLAQNPSINTVFIEYTNNQIIAEMNNWIWDDFHMSYRFPIYAPFMSLEDQGLLLQNNPSGFLNALSYSNKAKITTLLKRDYDYSTKIGGYLYLNRNKTDSLLKSKGKSELDKGTIAPLDTGISVYNLQYLKKMVELLQQQGKKIYFVRSPLHPKYPGYDNEKEYQQIRVSQFKGIKYLDFSKFPLPNSDYADLEHINYKGAVIFSSWFNSLLQEGLLETVDAQGFINERIPIEKKPENYFPKI